MRDFSEFGVPFFFHNDVESQRDHWREQNQIHRGVLRKAGERNLLFLRIDQAIGRFAFDACRAGMKGAG